MNLPIIGITTGDPTGIGPEIVAKSLNNSYLYKVCKPVVITDKRLFLQYISCIKNKRFNIFHVPVSDIKDIKPGIPSSTSGKAAYSFIIKAYELVKSSKIHAIVTAPVSKYAITMAGIDFIGHTELFANLSKIKRYAMLMVAGNLRTAMITRHIPLKDVSSKITFKKIVETIQICENFLKNKLNIKKPRIVIAALNPHAGENNLLGKEEKDTILPAIKYLYSRFGLVAELLPADSAWMKASRGLYDLVITMYHDQSMIPLKCLMPNKIVNITVGLPFVRTSPGHGTGFDIAGKNCANHEPMLEAILLASKLCSS